MDRSPSPGSRVPGKSIFVLGACLIVGACSTGYLLRDGASPVASPAEAAEARRKPEVVRGIGFIEPAGEIRRLLFRSDGIIESCRAEIGQRVKQGDLLMTLESGVQRAAVAVAEQELALAVAQRDQTLSGVHPLEIAAAERQVEQLRAQLRHAQRHSQRLEQLYQRKAASLSQYDQAETEVGRLDAQVRQAEAELERLQNLIRPVDRQVCDAQVALAEARLEEARQNLENTRLKAPFDGSVLEIFKREGELASRDEGSAVMAFADESRLRVRAEVDERYVHRLSSIETALIYGRGLGPQRYAGRVVQVKRLMGKKTLFTRDAAERKDLDVLQLWIEMPDDFRPPLGLQVETDLVLSQTEPLSPAP